MQVDISIYDLVVIPFQFSLQILNDYSLMHDRSSKQLQSV